MSEHDTHQGPMPVDEQWLDDWIAEGIAACETHLTNHAAFAAFLTKREHLESVDGDGAAAER